MWWPDPGTIGYRGTQGKSNILQKSTSVIDMRNILHRPAVRLFANHPLFLVELENNHENNGYNEECNTYFTCIMNKWSSFGLFSMWNHYAELKNCNVDCFL